MWTNSHLLSNLQRFLCDSQWSKSTCCYKYVLFCVNPCSAHYRINLAVLSLLCVVAYHPLTVCLTLVKTYHSFLSKFWDGIIYLDSLQSLAFARKQGLRTSNVLFLAHLHPNSASIFFQNKTCWVQWRLLRSVHRISAHKAWYLFVRGRHSAA